MPGQFLDGLGGRPSPRRAAASRFIMGARWRALASLQNGRLDLRLFRIPQESWEHPMSISSTRSTVARLQSDIADLRAKDAAEAKKEADLTAKINQAAARAQRATSTSSASSYLREVERAQKELATVSKKRANLAKSVASKSADLSRQQDRLSSEEQQERKKIADADKRAHQERERQRRQLDEQLRKQTALIASQHKETAISAALPSEMHDVFISHASEDKEDFVRDLAARLRAAGVSVWYDEFSIAWGDSLRRKIDRGLASSRFGIVVLSTAFFKKDWTQRELDGLTQLEIAGRSRVLPIWHKVAKDEVASFSPMLADKAALKTADYTVDEIVERLVKVRDEAIANAE